MIKSSRILCAFWAVLQLYCPTIFAGSLQIKSQPHISSSSFFIPIQLATSIGDFSIEHQFDFLQLQFPSEKYLIHSYERKSVTAISEVSELRWSGLHQSVAIGRNYIHSGPVIRNSSLFSSFSPSLNHVALNLELFKDFRFDYYLVRLDNRQSPQGTYKRWLYYRRLQLTLGKNWNLGLKEAVLATGLRRGVDLSYLNPGALFQLEQLHGNVEQEFPGQNNDNQLLGLDIEYRINNDSRLYFDFIIDEFQIDIEDRDQVQDVFGVTSGIELIKSDQQIFIEYWLGSPWLYTNGGKYTNVEVNNIPLGYLSPNAYGVSIGWIQEYQKYQANFLLNIHKQGGQTVNTTWNSVDNRIPLLLSDDTWQPELDLRVGLKNSRFLQEIRLTYNLLNSEGLFLILKFNGFEKQWSEKS